MRIEVNEEVIKDLEEIKGANMIGGKGYSQVITFLIQHYKQCNDIKTVMRRLAKEMTEELEEQREILQDIVENAIKNYFKRLFTFIIAGKDDEDE